MKLKTNLPEEYKTGISKIDQQHVNIILAIQEIVDTMNDKEAGANQKMLTLGKSIQNLSSYIDHHLPLEENLMRKMDYPDLEEHLKEHAIFREKLTELNLSLLNVDDKLKSTAQFLKKWFINHINVADMKYAKMYKEKMLKP